MTPKIDLEQAAIIADWIRQGLIENPKAVKLLFSGMAENTASALEALPKLIAALTGAIEIAAPVDNEEAALLEAAKQALTLFETTKTTEQ